MCKCPSKPRENNADHHEDEAHLLEATLSYRRKDDTLTWKRSLHGKQLDGDEDNAKVRPPALVSFLCALWAGTAAGKERTTQMVRMAMSNLKEKTSRRRMIAQSMTKTGVEPFKIVAKDTSRYLYAAFEHEISKAKHAPIGTTKDRKSSRLGTVTRNLGWRVTKKQMNVVNTFVTIVTASK